MKIAINGAGIAGPTLAYWLLRYGHEPILIEQAHCLRDGGYIVDFWGVGYDIAERMGLLDEIRSCGYQVREVRFVARDGRKNGGFGTDVFEQVTDGRFTSVRRSDISAAIYGAIRGRVEAVFENSITGLWEHSNGVRIEFSSGEERDVDLVVGADGLHSAIRRIAFGPDWLFDKFLGYYVAAFELGGYTPRDELVYVSHSEPGRQVSRFSMRDDRTLFLFVFRGEYLAGDIPTDGASRVAVLDSVFVDMGWECPDILRAMRDADSIYFDRVSQIVMESWAKGRVALVGDAAACVSLLAGEGTGLAIAEAYVLAGEIAAAGAEFGAAFSIYQRRLMPFARRKQASASAFASSFAPKTAFGVAIRDVATKFMRIPAVANLLVGRALRDEIDLPEYPECQGRPSRS